MWKKVVLLNIFGKTMTLDCVFLFLDYDLAVLPSFLFYLSDVHWNGQKKLQ